MKKKILSIIPARGGSKGIPNKNLIDLCGKPLIQYTIEASQNSKYVTKTILSSDDDKIIKFCKSKGVEVPFTRPSEYAKDDSPMIDVIKHAVEHMTENGFKPDYIVLLQPTSPLRKAIHIDEAIEKIINTEADSIVSVIEVPHNCNPFSIMEYNNNYLTPYKVFNERDNLRQKKPKFYARNGAAIYIFTYECLMDKNSIYGDRILPYFMNQEESVDIDSMFDLKMAKYILNETNN